MKLKIVDFASPVRSVTQKSVQGTFMKLDANINPH